MSLRQKSKFTTLRGSVTGLTLAGSEKHWKLNGSTSISTPSVRCTHLLRTIKPYLPPVTIHPLRDGLASHRFAKAAYYWWTPALLRGRGGGQLTSWTCHLGKDGVWITECGEPYHKLPLLGIQIKVHRSPSYCRAVSRFCVKQLCQVPKQHSTLDSAIRHRKEHKSTEQYYVCIQKSIRVRPKSTFRSTSSINWNFRMGGLPAFRIGITSYSGSMASHWEQTMASCSRRFQ